MPGLAPISRRNLLRRLKRLSFDGPYSGGRHHFMVRGEGRLILPNPHQQDISASLLARLLNQASITREEWESVA